MCARVQMMLIEYTNAVVWCVVADVPDGVRTFGIVVLPVDDRHKVSDERRYVALEDAGVAAQHVLVHDGDEVALRHDCG